MQGIKLDEVLKAINGELSREKSNISSVIINDISIDSRQINGGELFFALKGENFDGHDFVDEALNKGAAGAVVQKDKALSHSGKGFMIKVNSPLSALQRLSNYYRKKCGYRVVAVTGSTGKTTTKDMLGSILNRSFSARKTEGNYNNEIGLPLTLMSFDETTEVAVIEMGMRGLGEIAQLAEIAEPELGIVLNVGEVHIETLGSRENIARAKSELISFLPQTGTAVLNADDPFVSKMHRLTEAEVVFFGIEKKADIEASEVSVSDLEGTIFELNTPSGKINIKLPIPGRHFVYNALAAAAAAVKVGADLNSIKEGLENFESSSLRMKIKNVAGITLINDTYNANPVSVCAALDTLAAVNTTGRRIVVLGDMLELGFKSDDAHRKIGNYLLKKGIDALFTIGNNARLISDEALKKGMCREHIYHAGEKERAVEKIIEFVKPHDILLFKASRGIKLEDVVDIIIKEIG